MKNMDKLISVVIPVFRNSGSLIPGYEQLSGLFRALNVRYEIVYVNDGSDDNSLNELKTLYNANPEQVTILSFSRNFGQVAAITAGLRAAKGDCCVVISADLQDPIGKIEEMIANWTNGSDIVVCYRSDREDGFLPRMFSKFFYSLIKLSVPKMPEGGFDFLLMDKKVVIEYNKLNEKNRFFQGDILWLGFKLSFIPYTRSQRKHGKSQWSFSKKIKYFIDGLLNTSYIPIRLMSLMGLITALSGFLYSLIIVYYRFMEDVPFSGWAPIMILILIIGGIIMLMLGIIGEYIWRTYDESRNRPLYIIEEKFEYKN